MNSQEGNPVAAVSQTIPITQSSELLSQLFAEHHRRVLTAACRITGSMADAEDVTQAVFLRLASGKGLPMANAGSYLYRAAINGALDLLRRQKAAQTESLEEASVETFAGEGSSPELEASSRELGAWLRLAITELAPRAGEMFTLRYVEELGNREIAALMGTSQAVVAVTLHHARSRLKKRLRELERR
ncbi:MAG: RNA polymerase sigma factor [Terracidiphilus sp.]